MKKLLTIIALAISAMTVMAEEFKIGKLTFKITSPTEVCLSDAADDITTVYLGETIDYQGKMYTVTSIELYAFEGCSSLTSIAIPNSVTSIEEGAFKDCSSLTSVTIPNGVTEIEWYAFDGCSSLTSIAIPNSVTSIGTQSLLLCSLPSSYALQETLRHPRCFRLRRTCRMPC